MYGLDKPLPEQFVSWITAFWTFLEPRRWGYSFVDGRPVVEKIFERIPFTLELMVTSLVVTIIVSIPFGVLAAVRQYSWADKIITTLATIGYAMPSFVPRPLVALHLLVQVEPLPVLRAPVPRQGGQPAPTWDGTCSCPY